jgi:hypothetical protein
MDNKKNMKQDTVDNNQSEKDGNERQRSSAPEKENKQDKLTDEQFENEKKLHEAETERD